MKNLQGIQGVCYGRWTCHEEAIGKGLKNREENVITVWLKGDTHYPLLGTLTVLSKVIS
jgi:hypothetical protein